MDIKPTDNQIKQSLEERLIPVNEVEVHRDNHVRQAAVLVPLIYQAGKLSAIFTRRTAGLAHHPGEISFPGGSVENQERPLDAALREAQEEIGLHPDEISIVGALAPQKTRITGFLIYPFVGIIQPRSGWQICSDEVEEVIELQLSELRASHSHKWLVRRGIPWRTDAYLSSEGDLVWGATARIVRDLLARTHSIIG